MKVVALISGGKDSCFNMMHCRANGHEIVALANLYPPKHSGKDELDSFVYQTVGHDAIHWYAECMNLPLLRREIHGTPKRQALDYETTVEDETEDLYELLKEVKTCYPEIEAVSVGAILSNYQRIRVEHVCQRLGLTSLAYLWQQDQAELLNSMIENSLHSVLIKVAAMGLNERHLGKSLQEMQPTLLKLHDQFGVHVCGEGGEYETFTLDCPLFVKRIVVKSSEVVVHSNDAFAPVAYLKFKELDIEPKSEQIPLTITPPDMTNVSPVASYIESDIVAPSLRINVLESNNDESLDVPRVTVHANGLLAISGIAMPKATLEEEVSACMHQLQELLQSHSRTWQHVLAMHLWVNNMADFKRINKVYQQYFGNNPPTRVCVQVNLPFRHRLHIDCIVGDTLKQHSEERDTLHVQGLSYWAPANIGPYSQCVRNWLNTATLQLPTIDDAAAANDDSEYHQFYAETMLSLRHLARISRAMNKHLPNNGNGDWLCYRYKMDTLAQQQWKQYWIKEQDNNDSIVPAMLCVTVPALPRGAMIEWQTVLSTVSTTEDASLLMTAYDTTLDSVSYGIILGSVGTIMATATSTAATAASLASVDDITSIIGDLIRLMETTLAKLQQSWMNALILRVFYYHEIPQSWLEQGNTYNRLR
ncbi:hypothetical protein BDF22DRAFT_663954 [Syncephalis plumigaleata]|nr:hypothetical protein BDF22DRAFT_663954 [Syncephalis plumigaleata]